MQTATTPHQALAARIMHRQDLEDAFAAVLEAVEAIEDDDDELADRLRDVAGLLEDLLQKEANRGEA